MQSNLPLYEDIAVIGDGLTGLLAAQALALFVRQAVVVEQPPAAAPPLSAAPPLWAAPPPYLLNGRDQAALDELFPGLLAELVGGGAVRFNLGLHTAWSVNGRWRPRYRSTYEPVVCRPELLLTAVRKRLKRETAVQFRSAATTAELMIDTSGQTKPVQANLTPLAGGGRYYQHMADRRASWRMLIVEPDEPPGGQQRGAFILPLAANCFYLALWGTAANPPPLDEGGFLAFAQSTPNLEAAMLTQVEPLSDIMPLPVADWSLRTTATSQAQLPPSGYLPNPLLGQPVSLALAVSAALRDSLTEERQDEPLSAVRRLPDAAFNGRFQRQLAHQLRATKQLVQAEARRWAGLTSGDTGDLAPYLARLSASSLHNAPLLETLYTVQQGLAPLTRLFEPDIVLQTVN